MQGYSLGLGLLLLPGRSQACPKLTPVTSLSYQLLPVHYPKEVVCLLEARQLQGLERAGWVTAQSWKISEDVDLEPHQPGLLWVTSLNPEAGKLGLLKVCNEAVVPGGRP